MKLFKKSIAAISLVVMVAFSNQSVAAGKLVVCLDVTKMLDIATALTVVSAPPEGFYEWMFYVWDANYTSGSGCMKFIDQDANALVETSSNYEWSYR